MPIHAAPQRDPRSIVTPDAFEVAPDLLGLPLAAPGRRLAALLIDLAVIGLFTLLTKSFGVVLGLVIAVLFIREGFKRTPVRGSAFGRAMRFRVLRLDGEPITWWTAFERAGGYAAGIATGLLGFAQVYWDSNRQAIHDRIVGTVVVMDGAEKVLDWRKAL